MLRPSSRLSLKGSVASQCHEQDYEHHKDRQVSLKKALFWSFVTWLHILVPAGAH